MGFLQVGYFLALCNDFGDGFSQISIGKQAIARNHPREIDGSEARGPLPRTNEEQKLEVGEPCNEESCASCKMYSVEVERKEEEEEDDREEAEES